jgi:Fur family peroxide stress response transcriptional regulator
MDTQDNRIEELITQLRQSGMRLTPQRLVVLKALIDSQEHLSAEEIYERIHVEYPMIGLATVYKTIAILKEMGEVRELNLGNESARYDGSGKAPHPHFICNQCGSIFDIEDDSLVDLSKNVAEKTGYQITNYRLDFFGICPECQPG